MDLTIPQLNDPRLLWAGGITLLVLLWLLWAIARKIVRIGFFIIAFLAGTAIAAAAGAALGKPQPLPILAAQGLAFAWAWNLVRAKVARVVTSFMLLAAVKVGLTMLPDMAKEANRIEELPGRILNRSEPEKKPSVDKVQDKAKS
jgi:hypothetical protein